MTLALDANLAKRSTQRLVERKIPARDANLAKKSTQIDDIEKKRIDKKISRAKLCRIAGISDETYRNILDGFATPQRRTLIKLNRALDGAGAPRSADADLALYRSAFVAFAQATGLDPAHVDTPPTNCNYGIHASIGRARQTAFYLTVTSLDVPRSALRAVYTKAAASKAIRDVELRREQDPDFEKLIVHLGKLLTGRDLS